MKGKLILQTVTLMTVAALAGCTHLEEHKNAPDPYFSYALENTTEELETNVESPGASPDETRDDADVRIDF